MSRSFDRRSVGAWWLFVGALVGAAPAAAADFTGVLEMKAELGPGNAGLLRMTIGPAGMLHEMTVGTGPATTRVKSLMRTAQPGVLFVLDDTSKTYMEVPTGAGPAAPAESWTVTAGKADRVAGIACQGVQARSARGSVMELCMAKDLLDTERFTRAMAGDPRFSEGLMKSLRARGADGFPVRVAVMERGMTAMKLELVQVSRATPPATAFELPAGYQRTAVPQMPSLTPEMLESLEEQMRGLPPEQQEMMRQMMAPPKAPAR